MKFGVAELVEAAFSKKISHSTMRRNKTGNVRIM
jgi:hypothetical protein